MKRRLVSGLREVAKAVKSGRARCIVVAPNIEQISAEGGLDDRLRQLMDLCNDKQVAIVYALSRKKLGKVFGYRKKMSVVCILDFSGAERLYKRMLELSQEGRNHYNQLHFKVAPEYLQSPQSPLSNTS